jgi:hypothetical protein
LIACARMSSHFLGASRRRWRLRAGGFAIKVTVSVRSGVSAEDARMHAHSIRWAHPGSPRHRQRAQAGCRELGLANRTVFVASWPETAVGEWDECTRYSRSKQNYDLEPGTDGVRGITISRTGSDFDRTSKTRFRSAPASTHAC